ncbi:GNAT family N-acetyltransferase [Candidatus Dojkabacteria bacterium]|nr:GNAT family N-acetyltransferase [Candidatus Dojkabacteria bacterium]
MTNLTFKEFENIKDCREIWDSLVDIKTIYDEWDFRIAFIGNNLIHFKVAYDNGLPVALLPMQFNPKKNSLEFFGGNFMENNRIYVKNGFEHLRKELIESIQEKVILRCIMPEDEFIETLPIDDYTFRLNLENFDTLESYFMFVPKKLRNNFRKAVKNVTPLNPSIDYNSYDRLDDLISLSKKSHGETTLFNDPDISGGFYNLLKTNFNITVTTIEFENIPQSVSIAVEYGDTYYALMSASNREFVSGIGTFEKLKDIEYAIDHKFKFIDMARADCNWKEVWKFPKYPLYSYEKL